MDRGLFYAGSSEDHHFVVNRVELATDTLIAVPKDQVDVRGERVFSNDTERWVFIEDAIPGFWPERDDVRGGR